MLISQTYQFSGLTNLLYTFEFLFKVSALQVPASENLLDGEVPVRTTAHGAKEWQAEQASRAAPLQKAGSRQPNETERSGEKANKN